MTNCIVSLRHAIALPSPMVDPPPSATIQSARAAAKALIARAVTSTGVCIAASANTPAARSLSEAASAWAASFWAGVDKINARCRSAADNSSASRLTLPAPNTMRAGLNRHAKHKFSAISRLSNEALSAHDDFQMVAGGIEQCFEPLGHHI